VKNHAKKKHRGQVSRRIEAIDIISSSKTDICINSMIQTFHWCLSFNFYSNWRSCWRSVKPFHPTFALFTYLFLDHEISL